MGQDIKNLLFVFCHFLKNDRGRIITSTATSIERANSHIARLTGLYARTLPEKQSAQLFVGSGSQYWLQSRQKEYFFFAVKKILNNEKCVIISWFILIKRTIQLRIPKKI